ncbi:MAG: exodeoxyribonuclease III [Candidatus Kapaibacterium sp.]|nr:exodeoxyribonuclease III [Bacteroidota bacterium]
MKIVSWNVNGIRAVHKKGFFDYMNQEQPDIIGLQEVRAEYDQIDEDKRAPEGYHAFYNPCKIKKGYSGVAIYTKHKPESVTNGFGVEQFDQEGRVIQADFGDFIVINVYFPKAYSEREANGDAKKLARLTYKMEFYSALWEYISTLRKKGRSVIVCGDYNTAHTSIDLARPKENTQTSGFLEMERKRLDELVTMGFTDTFRLFQPEGGHYTWWSQQSGARERNVGWRIDYHFASNDLLPRITNGVQRSDVFGSDHCPVVVELK